MVCLVLLFFQFLGRFLSKWFRKRELKLDIPWSVEFYCKVWGELQVICDWVPSHIFVLKAILLLTTFNKILRFLSACLPSLSSPPAGARENLNEDISLNIAGDNLTRRILTMQTMKSNVWDMRRCRPYSGVQWSGGCTVHSVHTTQCPPFCVT